MQPYKHIFSAVENFNGVGAITVGAGKKIGVYRKGKKDKSGARQE